MVVQFEYKSLSLKLGFFCLSTLFLSLENLQAMDAKVDQITTEFEQLQRDSGVSVTLDLGTDKTEDLSDGDNDSLESGKFETILSFPRTEFSERSFKRIFSKVDYVSCDGDSKEKNILVKIFMPCKWQKSFKECFLSLQMIVKEIIALGTDFRVSDCKRNQARRLCEIIQRQFEEQEINLEQQSFIKWYLLNLAYNLGALPLQIAVSKMCTEEDIVVFRDLISLIKSAFYVRELNELIDFIDWEWALRAECLRESKITRELFFQHMVASEEVVQGKIIWVWSVVENNFSYFFSLEEQLGIMKVELPMLARLW